MGFSFGMAGEDALPGMPMYAPFAGGEFGMGSGFGVGGDGDADGDGGYVMRGSGRGLA